ncbi:MAG TPA: hypothetical protein DCX32_00275 [Candidatus Moranbacteria bacterium]|nr:MAG: hypothetical protein UW87_C0005G0022 [Candidatus Moranbacteria bacterium GW2011_GWC2_45_10]KKT95282.1 MAG: hypothetical protein UW95_C0002G0025 [Parcubacteria group bacterium GW2011_GWC1_45_14]HAV10973.1 hypothetical protein [Candidatus Moranbacteria bacterium]
MKKKQILFILLFFLASSLIVAGTYDFAYKTYMAQADDDEDDEDDDDDDDDEKETVTVTKEVIIRPGRTVIEEQVKKITLPDSDRDGLVDEEDPHPDMAEIYIVSDDDRNGISDAWDEMKKKLVGGSDE